MVLMPENICALSFLQKRQEPGGGRTGMIKIQFIHSHHSIISLENLLAAWKEFIVGKRHRKDVQAFEMNLMSNIIALHQRLADKTYEHSLYEAFNISDPKPRNIHKAKVRDRLLHHAMHRLLYPFFDRTFTADSYSCRVEKGSHRAIERFRRFSYKVSRNNTRTCWILKCDIRKFFANIDHTVLKSILERYISDQDTLWLLRKIIDSFSTRPSVGLPLGNLTSQLFVNIYMNEFDQWMKHSMKVNHYIRYADDFIILSHDKSWLEELLPKIADFLQEQLHLELHPEKVFIKTLSSGVDFLGWVHFPDHRVMRTVTKRRMLKTIKNSEGRREIVQSYLGLTSHGNTYTIREILEELI